ncbi:MAG: DUF4440 domain-containing protein [Pyrinomonadaceae bacterium]
MKQILAAFIITVAISAFAFAQIETKRTDKDEQMFRKLERKMFDAFEGKPNLEALEQFFADDYFTINADGKTANKQQTLEAMRSRQFQVDKIESDEFLLRRYGDTVVITGRSAYFKGGQKVGEVRHTQIWVKRSGRWQLSGWQGTPSSHFD